MAAAAPAPVDTAGPESRSNETDGSGATQGMSLLRVDDDSDLEADETMAELPAEAGPALPPGLLQEPSGQAMLAELIEHQVLTNFEIVQAARQIDGQTVAPRSLDSRSDFTLVLKTLAYDPAAADEWSVLGLSPLEGPDLSLNTVEARLRFAKLLASMIDTAPWPPAFKAGAHDDIRKITQAATTCLSSFDSWLRERKRVRPSKLPLWHELGRRALLTVLDTAPDASEVVCTQWSALLDTNAAPLSTQNQSRILPMHEARLLADLAEKGDPSFWNVVRDSGKPLSLWAPANASALGRLVASLLRRSANEVPCQYIRFIVPLDLHPGCSTSEAICDLWWHDFLSENCAAMIRNVEFHPQPMEFVSPGPSGPRHELRGLAIFTVSSILSRQPPRVREMEAPILTLEALPTYAVDFPSAVGVEVMQALFAGAGQSAQIGRIYRSPGHSEETPRGRVKIRYPLHKPRLEQELLMRQVRLLLPAGACFASQDLFTDPGALIAELGHADAINSIWSLCSGALFLGKNRLLLTTEAAAGTWQVTMDSLIRNDPDTAVYKLKHRPSRHGGRPFSSPSALLARIAATRCAKQSRGASSPTQAIADVTITGRLHADEHAVVRNLMDHLVTQTGLQLTEQSDGPGNKIGTWKWLSDTDASAPPGRSRLFLKDLSKVSRVKAALHDKTIKIGMGTFRLQVHSDLQDRLQGGGAAQ
ncbi:unnamed protein product [Prorocentrum cordatum]|uniref:Uncharacterized protein n=1 Tax=Prorocentrum cordatum TaxID=2364126 RepID=A0ABN9WEX2_9DINO|nr:unnamed protein product [Polarella glacialis]